MGLARRGGLLACLPVLALATPAPGAARGSHASPAGPRGARVEAARLLRLIVLPRGARPGGAAADSDPRLVGPSSQPAIPRRVDLHGFWHLPGDPAARFAWIERHAPAGARVVRRGTGTGPRALWFVGYSLAPADRRFSSEELLLSLARARRGGTLLRVDAQVVWRPVPASR